MFIPLTLLFYISNCVTFDKFIGTNSFIDAPQEIMSKFGIIREYHDWTFNLNNYEGDGSDVEYEFNRWSGFWDFDEYYQTLKDNGVDVVVCLQNNAGMGGEESNVYKPLDYVGADATNPSSYSKKADYMWQIAARYGSITHSESKLKVADGQIVTSGLNTLVYYEDWNEQDKWWSGDLAEFQPEEYAAMSSANCDGHGNTMSGNVGIKNADPNAKFVMGGLAKVGTSFISSMKTWFENNRPDGDWPIDVVNMHHYCNYGGRTDEGKYSYGESPEDNLLKDSMKEIRNWIDTNVPGTEFWLTEFGYDISENSDNRVPVIGSKTREDVQSEWIIRTYLILASAGVDRAVQFMIRDSSDNPQYASRFGASGFTTCKSCGQSPRRSYYDITLLGKALSGTYFVEEVEEKNSLYVYLFRNANKSKEAYAIWSPTSNGSTTKYDIDLTGRNVLKDFGTSYEFTGNEGGTVTNVSIISDKVSVIVGEMPIIIVLEFDSQPIDDNDDDSDDNNNEDESDIKYIVNNTAVATLSVFFVLSLICNLFFIVVVVFLVIVVVYMYKKGQK